MLSKHVIVSVTVLVGSLLEVCLARADGQPEWTSSTATTVKPEMRREFERYLKQIMAAHKQAGIPWFRTSDTFAGDTLEYRTVVPVMRFGDLDGPSVVMKVLGEVGWDHLSRNIARCYTAQTRQYATPQTELEIGKAEVPMGTYWVETTTQVAPGKMGDYLNWIKNDYRPALEKAGVAHFQVSQPIFGATAGEIVTARMLENLAEIDEGPILGKALNAQDARAINARSVALVISSNTRIVRMRADLSYQAGK
jgi:hypothetical protein